MIRFQRQPKPRNFEASVERPGAAWLTANKRGRPPSYWTKCHQDLQQAFGSLCAYSAMYAPSGTVDHFVSGNEDRSKLYSWNNYRFAAGWINSSKGKLKSTQMLDPFEVTDGWFEVLLPSLQLVLTDFVPLEMRERAQFVLERLHLGHDERVLRQRREWYRMYQEHELTLDGLTRKAPLIAAAISKQRNV